MARMPETEARPARLRIAIASAFLAAIWFAMLTVGTGSADDDILKAVYAGGHPTLVAAARGITFLGDSMFGLPFVVAAIALLAWLKSVRAAVTAFLVIGVGRLLVEIQKYEIARFRPDDEAHLVPVSTPSFPSGHSANSMIVCMTLAILFFGDTPWKRPAVAFGFALSLCIGLSRVLLGVHWPTDVIGGWAFGLLWVLLALPLAERLAR